MSSRPPTPEQVRQQLEIVLRSQSFRSAERSSRILRFVVEQAVAGNQDTLKEYTIGAEALGRGPSFDPKIDAIARVEVSRLRSRLEQYYATAGANDEIRFSMPRGSYVPVIEHSPPPVAKPSENAPLSAGRGWYVRPWHLGVLAGILLLAISVGGFLGFRQAATPGPRSASVSLDVDLFPEGEFGNVVGTQLAIAPDGSTVVFVAATPQGGTELRIRKLDGSDSYGLEGTEGARGPFFSPDGEWVAFWSTGKLKKISLMGGSPIALCDAPDLLGGSWGDDGNIVATLTAEAKLWRLPASGGKPVPVLDASPQILRFLWPQVLPGSRAVLFSNFALTPDSGSIEVLSLADGRRRSVVRNGMFGRYLPSGHLVYINQGSLYAQRFDIRTLEALGSPVLAASDVEFSPTFGFSQFDFSRNGTLIYRRRSAPGQFRLNLVARDGETELLTGAPQAYWVWPRVSPDRQWAAVARMDGGERRIWMLNLKDKGPPVPFTAGGTGAAAVWLPDGKSVILQGDGTLEWSTVGSTAQAHRLLDRGFYIPWSVSPDGTRLAYSTLHPATHFDLWTVPLSWDGPELRAGKPEPFLTTAAVETYPTFSPDGQWIAYVSLQSGNYEVYVRPFGRPGAEVKVSQGGGRLPVWLNGGNEILYETTDHRLKAVGWRVRNGTFEVAEPKLWSDARLGDTGVLPNFDVAANGRILALLPPPGQKITRNLVTFRFHFLEDLERRLAGH
jgi:eukaryotic-like serine/threonine-protein kinase